MCKVSNVMRNSQGFTLVEIMSVVVVLGIVLAIAIPYYMSYKRAACDRSASADVGKVAASLERLGQELVDLNHKFDEEIADGVNEKNALKYLVGPYYGWRGGGTSKCDVLMRMGKTTNRWVIMGCARRGSRPREGQRYVYRAPFVGGGDLPSDIGQCGPDANDGVSANWNVYPFPGPWTAGRCYTESIVDTGSAASGEAFPFRTPGSLLCNELDAGN